MKEGIGVWDRSRERGKEGKGGEQGEEKKNGTSRRVE